MPRLPFAACSPQVSNRNESKQSKASPLRGHFRHRFDHGKVWVTVKHLRSGGNRSSVEIGEYNVSQLARIPARIRKKEPTRSGTQDETSSPPGDRQGV